MAHVARYVADTKRRRLPGSTGTPTVYRPTTKVGTTKPTTTCIQGVVQVPDAIETSMGAAGIGIIVPPLPCRV